MDRENKILTQTEHFFDPKNKRIMMITGKWMEMKIIMLGKIIHTQKDRHYILSFNLNSDLKNCYESRKRTICLKKGVREDGRKVQDGKDKINIHYIHK